MPDPTIPCHYCNRATPVDVVCCDDDAHDKAAAEAFFAREEGDRG